MDITVGLGRRRSGRIEFVDCAFLFGIILLSALPYLSGLGFYSDDWWYLVLCPRYNYQNEPFWVSLDYADRAAEDSA